MKKFLLLTLCIFVNYTTFASHENSRIDITIPDRSKTETVDETALIEKFHKALIRYQKTEKDYHKTILDWSRFTAPDETDTDVLAMKWNNRDFWHERCESLSIQKNKLQDDVERNQNEAFQLSSMVNAYLATKNIQSNSQTQTSNNSNI